MSDFLHLSFATQQAGFDHPVHGLDQQTCPRCGSDTMMSFGLMGGGYGPMVLCGGEDDPTCDWFYKECLDDGDEHIEPVVKPEPIWSYAQGR